MFGVGAAPVLAQRDDALGDAAVHVAERVLRVGGGRGGGTGLRERNAEGVRGGGLPVVDDAADVDEGVIERGGGADRLHADAVGLYARAERVGIEGAGAGAVENAIRMARLHTHKHKILSTYRSYHGNTGAAINATGDPRRFPNEFAYGHVHFWGPYLYRTAFWAQDEAQECARALEHLEQTIIFEGPNTIGAILIESIPGTAGVLVPPAGYLEGIRALCDKYKILWIADEVMSGFGRTGKWFGYQHSAATPDLITFAKGVTSGYIPLGGIVISDEIAHTFDERVFPGGLTYMGHPLATATAVATIQVMKDEKMVENAASIGEKILGPGIHELAKKHKLIGDIRGRGVFWGVDLVTDRATREPLAPYGGSSPAMNELVAACRKNGLMPFNNFNRIHLCPPCNISEADAKLGLEIIDKSLGEVAKHYTGA
mgnify:CR=1 FL=1